ncbi:hypothetical protein DFP72DRAFT_915785 [Ephemerocybe angulata]|uniref:Uncharacterized protein n=1 Tax=Ephemerocybe angulata TaxID=980116 RepID=A0A8H6HLK5_9AGAR|nr:hypothetical protein DFP72DRAFT_915785 [Tulosesus angulatus]
MSLPARKKYAGDTRRLLLAFDIGTTFSGISYRFVPEIRPVTRFPSQEQVGGDSKIPTVIYYDSDGKDGIEADAEDFGWSKARWFKLHLRPNPVAPSFFSRIVRSQENQELPPLPLKKTVVEVFGDYMKYLHSCSKEYIEETHGSMLWASLKDNIMYVLTHPNGWGGPQQAQMRQAAVKAGLIPDTEPGRSRVTFVTEGEASLHFCLTNGLAIDPTSKSGVLIVDAGGGTIDLTAYSKLPDNSYEEIAIPQLYMTSSPVSLTIDALTLALLAGSRFSQDVESLVTRFDRNTKHVFRREDEPLHIQFTSHRERDQALNIRGGRLTIPGCALNPTSVFLVGGFSASPWLYNQVREQIEALGMTVSRPDTHVNKAVSNGAVSFYLDSAVTSRVARLTYGVEVCVDYNSTDYEHIKRGHRVAYPFSLPAFSSILPKNTRVKSDREFRRSFETTAAHRVGLRSHEVDILSYRGSSANPEWIDDDTDLYPAVCTVKADTSSLTPRVRTSPRGLKYYTISFDVVLLFGLTELKAQIAYKENGVERRYDSFTQRPTPY